MSKAVASGRVPRSLSLVTNGERRAQSDVEVARALMAGQAWAVGETWYRMAPMVLALAQRCLGSRSEAEDATQEVFYRVFRKVNMLREPESLRSFVYSFAIRVVKSELRKRRVRAWLSFGLPETSKLPSVDAPDMELRDLLARFHRLLDRLTPRDRIIFVLRRVEGMTVEEVAEKMSISPSTVKRSMTYSTQQLTRWVAADPRLKELLVSEVLPL
jgi:RNA polymerase sigma factor (sigma-70 family)